MPKPKRNTIAGQIHKHVARGEFDPAFEIAEYGRALTPLERTFFDYFFARYLVEVNTMSSTEDKARPDELEDMKRSLQSHRDGLYALFIDAVDRHDRDRIIEIAEAVWMFKDRIKREVPVDRERIQLLRLAWVNQGVSGGLTIRQVAAFLKYGSVHEWRKIPPQADGFSALRRKCKAIGVSIIDSRKRSRK
jgi:hypothetical protein